MYVTHPLKCRLSKNIFEEDPKLRFLNCFVLNKLNTLRRYSVALEPWDYDLFFFLFNSFSFLDFLGRLNGRDLTWRNRSSRINS